MSDFKHGDTIKVLPLDEIIEIGKGGVNTMGLNLIRPLVQETQVVDEVSPDGVIRTLDVYKTGVLYLAPEICEVI